MENKIKPVSGEIIAEREFKVRIKPRKFRPVYIRVRKPVSEGRDWFCTYEIEDDNYFRAHNIYGVDSIQALTCALMLANVEVEGLKNQYKNDFLFLGQGMDLW
jgi:hypothetical protein